MNKIPIILKREYLTRVRKRSFIIMTIIGPLLFAGIFVIPSYLAQKEDREERTIAVIDDTNRENNKVVEGINPLFFKKLPESKYIRFEYLKNTSVDSVRKTFSKSSYYGLLYIPSNITSSNVVEYFSTKDPAIDVKMYIEETLVKELQKQRLQSENIDKDVLEKVKADIKLNISMNTFVWGEKGDEKQSSTEMAMIIGYVSSLLIYMFIFMFGAQVMRGVIEEKTNRIVEVIISSVKPFQLMMGKVIGVALVGLTQFVIWILLTLGIVTVASSVMQEKNAGQLKNPVVTNSIMNQQGSQVVAADNQNGKIDAIKQMFSWYDPAKFTKIIICFLFYFLAGYLLYASLFAAVGSAVDGEADTQQFMMPITIPLILSILVMVSAIKSPDGPIAFWFSIIPFTSPIIMMARIPFDVPFWQILLSAGILIITFVCTTWLAAKIYRVGILMYGKKISYGELWKWIKYKN
ncbi:MAG: ABC transporter permease [Bacteroidia bacterium]|nr:ABC transporter permease [Bacteroidia bacterium]